ncbi:hypothetical protein RHMOL_Rhmol04G0249000 [Rhododendron molle]|uniref:Uncharacterized protein n=1 Tax=Rhododendron molle TaxID=49168 RepID=A0ACC0P6A2_RHOML|nr:hypothetical protein RHMOL_Rhmol04G0249000 [Rhododendron molle]
MGRKGNWFSSVKKAFSPESKEKKGQKSNKSDKKWFGKEKSAVSSSSPSEIVTVPHPLLPPPEEVKPIEVETTDSYSVALATAAAAEAAVVAAQAAAEVVRLTSVNRFPGKSKEEVAAFKIQTVFRGYMARRALRALRGLVRLKSLVQGPTVKRQTANALRCMQTVARVQSQIQSRRIRMSEENQALQRQLLQKRAKELASLRIGEEWDDTLQSKEQIEANLLSKYEAAMRRERALAYSFSHQQSWKKSTRPSTLMFMDPSNPHWGWSWLERWMSAEKDLNNDHSSVKSATLSIAGGEITKSYARHLLNADKPSPTSTPTLNHPSIHKSLSTSQSKARKLKPESPRGRMLTPDDDSKSVFSMQSDLNRRHSIAGSSVRDDESLASSPAFPSYMAPTKSAKAKLQTESPLGLENRTPGKGSVGSAKKRLSFPASTARPRRHSGPPRVESGSIAAVSVRSGGGS